MRFMHEWALAEAVLASAKEIAEKEKLKEVIEVTIRVGELQQVERPILRFALSRDEDAAFQMREVPHPQSQEHASMQGLRRHVAV